MGPNDMPQQPRFPDRPRLPLDFDPAGLAADMANFARGEWIEHFVKQNYDGNWSVIPLRGPAGVSHPVQMIYSDPGRSDFVDTPMLAGSRHFRAVIDAFACPLHAVRLMRLTPGSVIKEHHDNDLCFERDMVRIHIPVVTNDGVDLRLNGGALCHGGRVELESALVRPAQRRQPRRNRPGPSGHRRCGQ
jgi:hypothetical protein